MPTVDNSRTGHDAAPTIHNWSASNDKTRNSTYYPFRCTSGTSTSRFTPVMS